MLRRWNYDGCSEVWHLQTAGHNENPRVRCEKSKRATLRWPFFRTYQTRTLKSVVLAAYERLVYLNPSNLFFYADAVAVLINGAAGFVVASEHGMKLTDSVGSWNSI